MNLGDEVDLEDYVSRPDKISAAEISAICQEAGMHAVSHGSMMVSVCSCSDFTGGMLVGALLSVHSVGSSTASSTGQHNMSRSAMLLVLPALPCSGAECQHIASAAWHATVVHSTLL
jgi:hypothetical protein